MRAPRTDDLRDRIAAYAFPRGGVGVVRATAAIRSTAGARTVLVPACAQPATATRFR